MPAGYVPLGPFGQLVGIMTKQSDCPLICNTVGPQGLPNLLSHPGLLVTYVCVKKLGPGLRILHYHAGMR